MNGKKVVIFGGSEFAKLVHFYLSVDSDYEVAAFTSHERYIENEMFLGLPMAPFEKIGERYPPEHYDIMLCAGYKVMRRRKSLYDEVKSKGYGLVNYKSRRAILCDENLKLGENNLIMPGAQIEPFTELGDNNIVGPGCMISHYCRIGSHNYFSGGVVIGGGNEIGDFCFFGAASTVINDINVAGETHVLPGTVVYEDTLPFTKYLGTPAKPVGMHKEEGIVIERG